MTLRLREFSRATQLSVKTLRHYHEVGVLEPSGVDPQNGYRRYSEDQLAQAQVIRRLRALEMPVAEVRAVVSSDDVRERNQLISRHLDRLESELERTRSAVAALRDLLDTPHAQQPIEHRSVPEQAAIAIRAVIDTHDTDDEDAWRTEVGWPIFRSDAAR